MMAINPEIYREEKKRELRENIKTIDRYSPLLAKAASLEHTLTDEEKRDFEQATLDIDKSIVKGMADSSGSASYHNFNRAGIRAYLVKDYADLKRRLDEAVEQGKDLDQGFYDAFERLLYLGVLGQNGLFDEVDDYHTDPDDRNRPLTLSEINRELDNDIGFQREEFEKELYGYIKKEDSLTKQDLIEAMAKQMAKKIYSRIKEDPKIKQDNEYDVRDYLFQGIMQSFNMGDEEAKSIDIEKISDIKDKYAFARGRELKEISENPEPIMQLLLRSNMSVGEQVVFDYFSLKRMAKDREKLREVMGECEELEEIISDFSDQGIREKLKTILERWYNNNVERYQEDIIAGLDSLAKTRADLEAELKAYEENGDKSPGPIKEPWTAEKKMKTMFGVAFVAFAAAMGIALPYGIIKGEQDIEGRVIINTEDGKRRLNAKIFDHDDDGCPEIVEANGEMLVSPEFGKDHPLFSWIAGARQMTPKEHAGWIGIYYEMAKDKVMTEIAKAYRNYKDDLEKRAEEEKEKAEKEGKEFKEEKPDSFIEWAKARPKVLKCLEDPIAALGLLYE
ncbi:hypothetical protein KY343_06520 [Candidatus Woesearchaeota archaeon]|nr:hypothetical protein [Candidatus Woesearchaeota archaeon]